MSSLKNQLIRLGQKEPSLRTHLAKIINAVEGSRDIDERKAKILETVLINAADFAYEAKTNVQFLKRAVKGDHRNFGNLHIVETLESLSKELSQLGGNYKGLYWRVKKQDRLDEWDEWYAVLEKSYNKVMALWAKIKRQWPSYLSMGQETLVEWYKSLKSKMTELEDDFSIHSEHRLTVG